MVGDGGEAPQARLAGDAQEGVAAAAGEDRDLLTLARALVAEPTLSVALLDEELRYIAVNEGLAALQGSPREAHVGRTPTEVLGSIYPELLDRMRRVLETGAPLVHQEEAVDPHTGRRRYWTVSYRRVDREGGGRALAVFIRETTEQKEIELRERDARRDLTLAAGHVARLQAVTAALSEARTPTQVASVVVNQGVAALRRRPPGAARAPRPAGGRLGSLPPHPAHRELPALLVGADGHA
jgi:PAS domain S-box-containing protein